MLRKDERLPGPEHALRQARATRGLSVRELARRVGMRTSALRDLENGLAAMTYDTLLRLGQALEVDLAGLVEEVVKPVWPRVLGRRSVMRAGSLPVAAPHFHTHCFPAGDLRRKAMVPMIIDVQARTVEEMGGLVRHYGEEYLYVIRGSMELHSDLYEPLALSEGDSTYFDSGMAHAYVRTGEAPCRVLAVCAGTAIQQLAGMAGEGWHNLSAMRRGASRGQLPSDEPIVDA